MIKAVLFDVDGVLVDSFEGNLKFFQRLMTATGYAPPTRKEYARIFHLSLRDTVQALTQSASEETIDRIWDMRRSGAVKYDVDLLRMPTGAEDVIKHMSQEYRLGIVTSRIKETVYAAPQLAQLAEYFEVAISYQDTVNHKPHPEPLLLAAQNMGLDPGECIYIGDAVSDLEAGRAAGMKVIIYSENKHIQADAWTDSFGALSSIVLSLSENG